MTAQFVDVAIEPTLALPESLYMRWKASSAPREVRRVRYAADDGWEGTCEVHGLTASGEVLSALVCEVEDSAAGTSCLVWGGTGGIVLKMQGHSAVEPYLLLAPDDVLD